MERATELFKERIRKHLESLAEEDPAFAAKLANPAKSIGECADYVISWVEKQKRCGFADDEIYGQAVHYYDEETVGNVSHSKCRIVINEVVELTDEEKAEAKRQAMERMIADEKARMQRKPSPKKPAAEEVAQPTLF